MNSKTLSKEALNIIKEYKEMEISGIKISCPYFINKGQKIRAGLKVMIGKGSPKDIKEEINLNGKDFVISSNKFTKVSHFNLIC